MIKESFEAAILTELAAKSQIDIYVQILESDGGLYSTCNLGKTWYSNGSNIEAFRHFSAL